ncbi:MAG: DUF2846 domain-containing protein [Bryobacteraceae bacterium]
MARRAGRKLGTLLCLSLVLAAVCPCEDRSDTSKATVTVYRNSGRGTLKNPPVYMDEVQLAAMANKRYFSVTVDAGRHQFWSTRKDSLQIQLQAGKNYYILAQYPETTGVNGFNMKPRLHLFQVVEEQGKRDISQLGLKQLEKEHLFNGAGH